MSACCAGGVLFGAFPSETAAQQSTRQTDPSIATSRRASDEQSVVREPSRFEPPAQLRQLPTSAQSGVQTPTNGGQLADSNSRTSHIIPPTNTLRWRTSTKVQSVEQGTTQTPGNPFRSQEGEPQAASYEGAQVQYTTQDRSSTTNPIDDPFGDRAQAPSQPSLPSNHSIITRPMEAPTNVGQQGAAPLSDPRPTGRSDSGAVNASTSSTELLWQRNSSSASSAAQAHGTPAQLSTYYQEPVRQRQSTTTNEARQLLMGDTIQDINLNVSPWYDAEVKSYPEELAKRREFAQNQTARSWTDFEGQEAAFGKMIAVENRSVHVDVGGGEIEVLPINDLSDSDRAYVYNAWMYPMESIVVAEPMPSREWIPQTFTWKASALCHKSLFYEDVQLERYGHSAGPILQPVKSTAHFFLNLAFVPYNSAIHPVNECNYALGYYRPGDCAPWLANPIPLSARGAFRQALAVNALVFAVP